MSTLVDENWEVLLSAFPSGWQELGRETGAIKHQLKEFRSESAALLRCPEALAFYLFISSLAVDT